MSSSTQKTADALLQRHPLQRLPSPSRSVSAMIHMAGLANFAYCFKYLIDHPNPMNDAYGWHMQYLTIWGLALATATFVVGFLADVTLSSRLFLVKNAFSVTSAPMEVLISILYWGIRTVDPGLVLPDWLPRLPFWDDFSFHAAPAIFLAIDLLFLSPPWTISTIPAMGVSSVIATAYWFWTERNAKLNGFYPYPIFDVDPPLRLGIFAVSAIIMTLSTLSLKYFYSRVNGKFIEAPRDQPGRKHIYDGKKN